MPFFFFFSSFVFFYILTIILICYLFLFLVQFMYRHNITVMVDWGLNLSVCVTIGSVAQANIMEDYSCPNDVFLGE